MALVDTDYGRRSPDRNAGEGVPSGISEIAPKYLSWKDKRKDHREVTGEAARLLDRLYAAVHAGDKPQARLLRDQANRSKSIPNEELNRSVFDFVVDEGEKEMAKKSGQDLKGPGFVEHIRSWWWNMKREMREARQGMEPINPGPTINTWAGIPERPRVKFQPELPLLVTDLNLPPKPRFRPRGQLPVGWRVV